MQFNLFPHSPNVDFMRLRWASATLSVLLLVVAIGAMAVKGFNFAFDFTGGWGVEQPGFDSAVVQTFDTGTDLLVRLQAPKKEGSSGADTESIGDAVAKA